MAENGLWVLVSLSDGAAYLPLTKLLSVNLIIVWSGIGF
jgi:hypothetical protein